ncbi:MAG: competence/damage-inducible protein A [Alphaproteobacteria bacterium]|nr:competence/damage-inducible protein A [Alphaproteobacteria bacterium]
MSEIAAQTYTAAILIIGNEILSGRTTDTNTSWIAEKLVERGTILREVRVIPDEEDAVVAAINELRARVDYLFTTGGIGPTHDDITAACVGRAFDVELVPNEEAYQMLADYYGPENVNEARMKMAMIPKGAKLIPNPISGAPGFAIENVFVMAGVPRIMQVMFVNVLSMLKMGAPVLSNTVACSLQESVVAAQLGALQDSWPDIEIGSYPHYRGGVLGLSIVLRSIHNDRLNAATRELLKIIREQGGEPRAVSIRSTGEELGF